MNDEFPEYASNESAAVHALGWLDPASAGTVPPLQPAVTNRRESYSTPVTSTSPSPSSRAPGTPCTICQSFISLAA